MNVEVPDGITVSDIDPDRECTPVNNPGARIKSPDPDVVCGFDNLDGDLTIDPDLFVSDPDLGTVFVLFGLNQLRFSRRGI